MRVNDLHNREKKVIRLTNQAIEDKQIDKMMQGYSILDNIGKRYDEIIQKRLNYIKNVRMQ
jgi:hypothetical protein